MKVVLLTNGSARIGMGHISRCFGLYQAYQGDATDVQMIVQGDERSKKFLEGLCVPHSMCDWLTRLPSVSNALVVVDSYLASAEIYRRLRERGNFVVAIDDYKRIDYPSNVVVVPSIYGEKLGFEPKRGTSYLLGKEYVILREPFWSARKRTTKEKVEDLLLTFGGNDYDGITTRVLERCSRLPYRLHVVLGGNLRDSFQTHFSGFTSIHFYSDLSAFEMAALMYRCDVCISAGGQTTYELANTGLPAIGVGVAENQRLNLETFEKLGFLIFAGWAHEEKVLGRIEEGLEILRSPEERERRGAIGKSSIDGQGANRIARQTLCQGRKN